MVGPSQNKTPGISRVTSCIRAFSLVAGNHGFCAAFVCRHHFG